MSDKQKRRERRVRARAYAAGAEAGKVLGYAEGYAAGKADGYQEGYTSGKKTERQRHEIEYAVGRPEYGLHGDPIQLNATPEHTLVRLRFDSTRPALAFDADRFLALASAGGTHIAIFRARKKAWRDGITGHSVVWYDWDFDSVHPG